MSENDKNAEQNLQKHVQSFIDGQKTLETMIVCWGDLTKDTQSMLVFQVEELFFDASSLKKFDNEGHKSSFYKRWCGNYLTYFPNTCYLLLDQNFNLLSYFLACADTRGAKEKNYDIPTYDLFANEQVLYPAHLHMNTHRDFRGLGLGELILNLSIADLIKKKILSRNHGLFLVTEKTERNYRFYRRQNFLFEKVAMTSQEPRRELVFLGYELSKLSEC